MSSEGAQPLGLAVVHTVWEAGTQRPGALPRSPFACFASQGWALSVQPHSQTQLGPGGRLHACLPAGWEPSFTYSPTQQPGTLRTLPSKHCLLALEPPCLGGACCPATEAVFVKRMYTASAHDS